MRVITGIFSAGPFARRDGALTSSRSFSVQRDWYPPTIIWMSAADWPHWQACVAILAVSEARSLVIIQVSEKGRHFMPVAVRKLWTMRGECVSRTVAEGR